MFEKRLLHVVYQMEVSATKGGETPRTPTRRGESKAEARLLFVALWPAPTQERIEAERPIAVGPTFHHPRGGPRALKWRAGSCSSSLAMRSSNPAKSEMAVMSDWF